MKDSQKKIKILILMTYFNNGANWRGSFDTKPKQEKYYEKYNEYAEMIERDISTLISYKADIMKTIDKVDNTEVIKILYSRYIYFLKWAEIADCLSYGRTTIYRIHLKGLDMIYNIINKGEKYG